jgi:hypothetical protein
MDGMEATNESSLSDGDYSLYISAAIEQRHLHESIFHLLRNKALKPLLTPLNPLCVCGQSNPITSLRFHSLISQTHLAEQPFVI